MRAVSHNLCAWPEDQKRASQDSVANGALDCAASEYYKDGMYELDGEGAKLTRSQTVD